MVENYYTSFGIIDFYDVYITIGSILAIFLAGSLLYREYKSVRHTVFVLLLCAFLVFIGNFVSTLIRQLGYADYGTLSVLLNNIKNGYGNHFIGRVLTIALLFYPFYMVLSGVLFSKRNQKERREDARKSLDILSFFILIQHFFNRMGCFCRGCCYGKPYHGIGAVRFAKAGRDAYPVFPTQLFEMAAMGLLLLLVFFLYRKGKRIYYITWIGFGAAVWLSECFMDQRGNYLLYGQSAIQYAAVLLIVVAFSYYLMEKSSLSR